MNETATLQLYQKVMEILFFDEGRRPGPRQRVDFFFFFGDRTRFLWEIIGDMNGTWAHQRPLVPNEMII
jgi:hypothetical protein